MNKLKLQEFLYTHPNDWEEKLSSDPYNLKIVKKDNRVLFKYNQISSDFSNPIVCEARGIILDKRDWSIVCRPLHKFFNYGEHYAADIDWESAEVYEKKDGSLLKLYSYEGEWRVATNGTIDACDADIQFSPFESIQTFEDLFYVALEKYIEFDSRIGSQKDKQIEFFSKLNPNYTYCMELCTPLNRVVVPYNDYHLYFITAKRNTTGQEVRDAVTPVEKIPSYKFNSLEDVIKMAENLPYDEEGYVVVDKYNNRIKIKSPQYLRIHRIKGEETPSPRRIFELILTGEGGEFLSYFPEYEEQFIKIRNGLSDYLVKIDHELRGLFSYQYETRKDFAMEAKKTTLPGLMFQWYDDNNLSTLDYIRNMSQNSKDKIIKEILNA